MATRQPGAKCLEGPDGLNTDGKTMEEKISKIFQDVIGIDAGTDRAAIVYSEIPGWDSVAHMALVAALEEAFDCMLDMDDIIDMSNYDKVVTIMAKYA